MGWACSTNGGRRKEYKTLVRETQEIPSRSWKDNIKVVLREIGWEGVGWVETLYGGGGLEPLGSVIPTKDPSPCNERANHADTTADISVISLLYL
jgi:hypothetical protein